MAIKKIKPFLLTGAVMLVAAAITIYFIWNKPHKNVADAPAVEVQAEALYNSFIIDSATAKNKYVDKIILVKGRVAKTSVNQQAQHIILLHTGVEGAYINCTLEKNANGILVSDNISIKGICSGYISGDADMGLPGDVFITRGYIIK